MDSIDFLKKEHIVESLLFMMGESVSVESISLAIELNSEETIKFMDEIVEKYKNEYHDRGFKIIRINKKYQMVTNEVYYEQLIKVVSKPQKPVLTDSILETLSIIAYKQPITKPEIEDIRGVKSDFVCNRLIEYGLIEEKGRLEAPGRPILLGTTEEFLYRFGIEDINQLPSLDEDHLNKIEKEVEQELSNTLGETVVIDKDNKSDNFENELEEKKTNFDDFDEQNDEYDFDR